MEAINVKYHIINPVEHAKRINDYDVKVMLVVKA
jgi:hypothetical protein